MSSRSIRTINTASRYGEDVLLDDAITIPNEMDLNLPNHKLFTMRPRIYEGCYGRGKGNKILENIPPLPPALVTKLLGSSSNRNASTSIQNRLRSHNADRPRLAVNGLGRGSMLDYYRPKQNLSQTSHTSSTDSILSENSSSVHSAKIPLNQFPEIPSVQASAFSAPNRVTTDNLQQSADAKRMLADDDILLLLDKDSVQAHNSQAIDQTQRMLSNGDRSSFPNNADILPSKTEVETHFLEKKAGPFISTSVTGDWKMTSKNVVEIGVLSPEYEENTLLELLKNFGAVLEIDKQRTESNHQVFRVRFQNSRSANVAVSIVDGQALNKDSDDPVYCQHVIST